MGLLKRVQGEELSSFLLNGVLVSVKLFLSLYKLSLFKHIPVA